MNFLQKLFGARTTRAASGSLPVTAVTSIAQGLTFNVSASHGASWVVYSVQNTNSMLPVFDANAVLLAEACPYEALRAGDIVTYLARSRLIVHRLNEKRPGGWWPLGDGNGRMDPDLVTPQNFDRRIIGILYAAKDASTD